MGDIIVGQWVVIRKAGRFYGGDSYQAAEVEKVTPKRIHANAHYCRQHAREDVISMPDESAAKLFAERAKSAFSEANQRERLAWEAYRETIAKLVREVLTKATEK